VDELCTTALFPRLPLASTEGDTAMPASILAAAVETR